MPNIAYIEVPEIGASAVQFREKAKKDFRAWRESKGYTQEEAARIIGVSKPSISEFENDPDRMPRGDALDRLMEVVEDWRDSVAEETPQYTAMAMVICPTCGEPTPGPSEGMSFCGHCGEALGYQCPGFACLPP